MLPVGGSCTIQTTTASLMACEKAGRWSTAVDLCRALRCGRLQADQMAVNGILKHVEDPDVEDSLGQVEDPDVEESLTR